MKRMNRLRLMAVAVLLLVFACARTEGEPSGKEPGATRTPGPELRLPGGDWGLPSPFTFYPRGPGYMHLSLVYDTLTWKDRTGHIPWLASKWEMSEDGAVWSFALREGLTWHDGRSLTAHDVRFTFEYLGRYPVEWLPVDIVDRVEAPDALTVVFHLKRPFVPFIDQIAGNVPIVPRHVWGEITDPRGTTQLERLIGSGPYRLVRYEKTHGAYAYDANADYFLGRPEVGRLLFLPVGDRVAALLADAVDVSDIPAPLAVSLREHPFLKVLSGPAFWVLKLQFNRGHPLLAMAPVRQAIAHAVDRTGLVRQSCPGGLEGAKPGSPGLIPPDSEWFDKDAAEMYPPDEGRARSLLEASGLSDLDGDGVREGPDGRSLRLTLLSPPQSLRDAEALKLMLAEAGLALNVKALDQKALDAVVQSGSYDLALFGHGGVGGDPSIAFGFGLAGNVSAGGVPSDPEYARLASMLESTTDHARRRAIAASMQRLYAAELPCLALYYPVWHHAYNPRVFSGWFHTGAGGISTGIPSVYNKLAFIEGR